MMEFHSGQRNTQMGTGVCPPQINGPRRVISTATAHGSGKDLIPAEERPLNELFLIKTP